MFAFLRLGGSVDLEEGLVSTTMNSLSHIDLRRFLIESESAFAWPDLVKCWPHSFVPSHIVPQSVCLHVCLQKVIVTTVAFEPTSLRAP